ncbi:hypothetical protein GCM10011297_13100 [Bacterioplanes sanyensis]|uniref:hypothetical protein n=1 Tax=Bacterioplanes sanyensis TaxID=1249553 RepID=UPI001671E74F|nr:hypothetical protein [Bacterioplanes sanyensis]GGY41482.1 hypothetical protein GCM10011297_13100 [Bacterioplanes sanyensis]
MEALEFSVGQRQDPRIKFPARLVDDEVSYAVIDWSVTGFALADGALQALQSDCQYFCIDLPEGTLSLAVHAHAVRYSDQGFAVGFRFSEQDWSTRKTLQSVVHSYFNSDQIELDEVIQTGVKTQLVQQDVQRLRDNRGRVVMLGAGVACLIAIAIWLVYHKWLVVEASYAAVALPVIELRANNHGQLAFHGVTQGQNVSEGQPLFSITSDEQQEILRDKRLELQALQIALQRDRGHFSDMEQALAHFRSNSRERIAALRQQADLLQQEVSAQRQQVALFERRYREGVVDALTRNEQQLLLNQRQRLLLNTRYKITEAERALSVAEQGLYIGHTNNDLFQARPLAHDLQHTERMIAALSTEIQTLEQGSVYTSPCDCLVHEVNSYQGPIAAQRTVLTLTPAQQQSPQVLALLPLTKIERIQTGMDVEFFLASSEASQKGTVEQVRYFSSEESTLYSAGGELISGLPKNLPKVTQFALLRIRPVTPLAPSLRSEPARVNIYPGFWHSAKVALL